MKQLARWNWQLAKKIMVFCLLVGVPTNQSFILVGWGNQPISEIKIEKSI
jgi:hypothetical protein